jgi:sugar lactone lactonase YvrE
MAAQFQLTARRVTMPPSIPAANLGESPSWDDEHGVLWWIDIIGQVLYVGQPAKGSLADFDRVAMLPLKGHRVGFVVHTTSHNKSGGGANAPFHAIWGSQSGLYYTPYSTGLPWCSAGSTSALPQLNTAANAPQHRLAEFPLNVFALQGGRVYRFNDGKVAPDGSLWTGGMMERSAKFPKRDGGCGVLMQWTPNAAEKFTVGASQVTVSNGIGWSPAGDILYHVDTPTAVIRAYPYHRAAPDSPAGTPGSIVQSEGCVFWSLPAERKQRGATLDGLCVDSDGAVWVALAGIGEVVRLQARKQTNSALPSFVTITGVVTVPGVSLSTSCCFGGADLTTLYITTARGTDPAAVGKCTQTGAGFVYAVNLKGIAKGMPAARLRLPLPMQVSHL